MEDWALMQAALCIPRTDRALTWVRPPRTIEKGVVVFQGTLGRGTAAWYHSRHSDAEAVGWERDGRVVASGWLVSWWLGSTPQHTESRLLDLEDIPSTGPGNGI